MTTKKITVIVILTAIVALIGWDIYAVANSESGDTISHVVLAASLKRPAIPFAVGFICGHLFWPQGKHGEETDGKD
jgi:uncharacterized membrane protein